MTGFGPDAGTLRVKDIQAKVERVWQIAEGRFRGKPLPAPGAFLPGGTGFLTTIKQKGGPGWVETWDWTTGRKIKPRLRLRHPAAQVIGPPRKRSITPHPAAMLSPAVRRRGVTPFSDG